MRQSPEFTDPAWLLPDSDSTGRKYTMAKSKKQLSGSFTAMSFLWRSLAALALVLLTFNPSGFSFYHWIYEAVSGDGLGPLHFFVLAVLVAGWSILLVATWNALDVFGMVLVAVLLGTLVWLLVDVGLVSADSTSALTWIVLVCIALLLAVGLSWSHIWRRVTGQYTVDETND